MRMSESVNIAERGKVCVATLCIHCTFTYCEVNDELLQLP